MNKNTWYPWMIVFGCALMIGASVGFCFNTVGVFFTPIAEDWGVGRGAVSLSGTICQLTSGLAGLASARFAARGKLKQTMILGSVLLSAATFLASCVNGLPLYYFFNIVRGFGGGLCGSVAANIIIARWFRIRNGFAVSIAFSFSGVAGALFSPLFTKIIEASGWRPAMRWLALLMFAVSFLPTAFILRCRPSELGMRPYGAKKEDKEGPASGAKSEKVPLVLNSTVIMTFALCMFNVTGCSLTQHFTGYTEWIGLSSSVGALMMSAAMVGNIVSKLVFGIVADRIGGLKTSAVFQGVIMVSALVLLFLRADMGALYVVTAFFFGSSYGVASISPPILCRELFTKEQYGMVYSCCSMIGNIASALALTLYGAAYDMTGGYTLDMLLVFTFGVSALILIGVLLKKKRRIASLYREAE